MKNIVIGFAAVIAFLLTVAMLFTAGWVHPPILSTQTGFRGLAMDQLKTPAQIKLVALANKLPDPIDPAPAGGDPATSLYQNVRVLNNLTVDQFNRVMLGMTAWVAPADQSCNYCHGADSMATDDLYTKRVARRMLQMTLDINKNWKTHVAANADAKTPAVGVTCYTCHRGQPVPKFVWFREPPRNEGFATNNQGMGHPNAINGSTAMSTDPFTNTLLGTYPIRVTPVRALPVGYGASIQATERSYSLMIAFSKSLGVNCDFCHNTRNFPQWDGAPPQRVTAWHGIQMVRHLNVDYLEPLKAELPAKRMGPLGDSPKVYCATCHQGASKPLLGVSMAKDWPELGGGAATH